MKAEVCREEDAREAYPAALALAVAGSVVARGTATHGTSHCCRALRHAIELTRWTASLAARYASPMKDQWKQGLQWGAAAVVARWLAPWVMYPFWRAMGDTENWQLMRVINLGATVPIFALIVVTWTRYSRLAVAALVVVLAWQVEPDSSTFPSVLALRVIYAVRPYAEIVSFLPLLFITPERPRLTVALALVGRWREAARSLAGWRWPLVAVGVFLFGDVAGVLARSFYGMSIDNAPAVLFWNARDTFYAIAPSLAPLVIAALPPWRRLATA